MDRTEQIANIINEMLPQISHDIQQEQRQLSKINLQSRLNSYRQQLKSQYDVKIEDYAKAMNNEAAQKLRLKKEQLVCVKAEFNKARTGQLDFELTCQDRQKLMECTSVIKLETMKEIVYSPAMNEIREGLLRKKYQQLQCEFENRMASQLQTIRRQLQSAYNQRKKVKRQYQQQSVHKNTQESIEKLEKENKSIENQKEAIRAKLVQLKNDRDSSKNRYQLMAGKYTAQVTRLRKAVKEAQ